MTTTIDAENNVEITTTYTIEYRWKQGSDGGFSFPCDEQGKLLGLKPPGAENYAKCVSGEHAVNCLGVQKHVNRQRLCPCHSLKHYEDIYDARNIYVARVCEDCKEQKLRGYRPEIFTDSQYDTFDEQVEADY